MALNGSKEAKVAQEKKIKTVTRRDKPFPASLKISMSCLTKEHSKANQTLLQVLPNAFLTLPC